MLDALKFAFEILIVGALALPWIALIDHIFPAKNAFGLHNLLLAVPASVRNAVSIALIVSFGYLLGSATSRFSKDFFNDELWAPLPTEDLIREGVYYDEFCAGDNEVLTYIQWPELQTHPVAPLGFCPGDSPSDTAAIASIAVTDAKMREERSKARKATPPNKNAVLQVQYQDKAKLEIYHQAVHEVFSLQESKLLLEGLDKVDRLKQYFDQITVLRGAAFNFFIVFALCLFGSLGQLRAHWNSNRLLRLLPFAVPLVAIAFVIHSGMKHIIGEPSHIFYSDPPLAEIVWIILSVVGFAAILKGDTAFPYVRICLISGVIMAVSYGGWWWTEVMYDTQIIHSLPKLGEQRELPELAHPAGKKAATTEEPPAIHPYESPLAKEFAPEH
jgi:hypothetical protein